MCQASCRAFAVVSHTGQSGARVSELVVACMPTIRFPVPHRATVGSSIREVCPNPLGGVMASGVHHPWYPPGRSVRPLFSAVCRVVRGSASS